MRFFKVVVGGSRGHGGSPGTARPTLRSRRSATLPSPRWRLSMRRAGPTGALGELALPREGRNGRDVRPGSSNRKCTRSLTA